MHINRFYAKFRRAQVTKKVTKKTTAKPAKPAKPAKAATGSSGRWINPATKKYMADNGGSPDGCAAFFFSGKCPRDPCPYPHLSRRTASSISCPEL